MMSSATANPNINTMSTTAKTNSVLTAFNLHEQEPALARAFRATNAAIHGGAALSWYLNTPPPPGQDIDIWCQPAEAILRPIIYALFDTIFRAAGYRPLRATYTGRNRSRYYRARDLHIVAIHDWFNPVLDRKIQLIFRATHDRKGFPVLATPTGGFDLDITSVQVAASIHPTSDCLTVSPPHADLADRIERRVMRICNLTGQVLRNNLNRVRKYYERGFAFETMETHCSCTCGAIHHTIVTPPRRLTIEEATTLVRKEWVAANALHADHPYRANTFRNSLHAQVSLDMWGTGPLEELISECSQVTSLVQNKVLYPTETAWIKQYAEMAVFVLNLRRLQDGWAITTVEHRKRNALKYIQRLLHLQISPQVEHFPTLGAEIIHLLKEIRKWQSPPLVSYDEDDTTQIVRPIHVPKNKVVKKVVYYTTTCPPVSASTNSIKDELNKAVTDADTILYA